jgi:hypothetical protein
MATNPLPTPKFCWGCGASITPTQKFCVKCGKPLNKVAYNNGNSSPNLTAPSVDSKINNSNSPYQTPQTNSPLEPYTPQLMSFAKAPASEMTERTEIVREIIREPIMPEKKAIEIKDVDTITKRVQNIEKTIERIEYKVNALNVENKVTDLHSDINDMNIGEKFASLENKIEQISTNSDFEHLNMKISQTASAEELEGVFRKLVQKLDSYSLNTRISAIESILDDLKVDQRFGRIEQQLSDLDVAPKITQIEAKINQLNETVSSLVPALVKLTDRVKQLQISPQMVAPMQIINNSQNGIRKEPLDKPQIRSNTAEKTKIMSFDLPPFPQLKPQEVPKSEPVPKTEEQKPQESGIEEPANLKDVLLESLVEEQQEQKKEEESKREKIESEFE